MENTTIKVTKKTKLAAILDLIDWAVDNGYDFPETVSADVLRDYANNEVTILDNKAASAQKRAADRKVEGDAIREKVEAVLTSEPQTVHSITSAVGDPDISDAMVVARLKQLAEVGRVVKDSTKVSAADGGKTRTLVTYRLAD